jgi:hypothetical protein
VIVGFLSSVPVDDSVVFYTTLLGEPEIAVEGDPGERSVQWPVTDGGWIVSVLGSPDESIISISQFNE